MTPIETDWTDRCIYAASRRHNGKGYSMVRLNKKDYVMTRLVYRMFNGIIPYGYFIMHTCDNPPCINPKHLRAGTQKENIQDAANKGRLGLWRAKITHCYRGHKKSEENKTVDGKCKACCNLRAARYRARKKNG